MSTANKWYSAWGRSFAERPSVGSKDNKYGKVA